MSPNETAPLVPPPVRPMLAVMLAPLMSPTSATQVNAPVAVFESKNSPAEQFCTAKTKVILTTEAREIKGKKYQHLIEMQAQAA